MVWAAILLGGTSATAFAQHAAPFQMLPGDLKSFAEGAPVPGPFVVNQADVDAAVEFSAGMTAGGTLTQNSGETAIFTGTGSAGSAEIINNGGGSARFYDDSTAASALITNNGALQFSGNASAGQAQIVTNAGSVTVFADSAVAGIADPLLADPTLTNNGLTSFIGQSRTGASKITNNQAGQLHFAGQSMVDSGLENSGLTVLSDEASLGTGFIVNNMSGSILLRDNATAGASDIANSGTLVFAGQSSAQSAAINNNASGTLAFIGSASAGAGNQIVNDGRLYFGDSATAGSAIITTQQGGQTVFYGQASGGNAAFKVDIGGVLDISLLDVDGLTLGSLIGDPGGAGSVIALGSKTLTLGGNNQSTMIAGLQDGGLGGGAGGSLVKVGSGELELAGINSYTGATRVLNGRLKAASANAFAPLSGVEVAAGAVLDIGAWSQSVGSLEGAGTVILGNAGDRLTIGTNNLSTTFSGAFEADGGIIKTGSGVLTLSGDSTNTGDSRVENGTLRVLGDFSSSPLAVSGGVLAGSGQVGQVQALNGGAINPGGGSHLTIANDLAFDSGAIYRVDISDSGSDSMTVLGHADLGGAQLAVGNVTAANPIGTHVILTAASKSGTFFFEPYDYAFLLPELDQSTNVVTLTLARNGSSFSSIAETANQRAAAGALEGFSPADPVVGALLTANAADARRFYALAGGEVHVAAQTVSQRAYDLFADSLSPNVSTGDDEGHFGWVTPLGGLGRSSGDGNGAGLDWGAAGLAAGYEAVSLHASGHGLLGVGVGTLAQTANIEERLSSLAATGVYAGIYGQWRDGPLSLDGRAGFGTSHTTTTRGVEIGGLSRTARADYWVNTVAGSLEGRYEFEMANGLQIGPVASLDIGWTGHGGAMETGAGSLNQVIVATGRWRLDTGLGLSARYNVALEDGASLAVTGKAVWQHSFGETTASQTVALAGGGGAFTTSGPDMGRDRLKLSAGVEYRPVEDVIMSLDYTGTVGGAEMNHMVGLALRVRF